MQHNIFLEDYSFPQVSSSIELFHMILAICSLLIVITPRYNAHLVTSISPIKFIEKTQLEQFLQFSKSYLNLFQDYEEFSILQPLDHFHLFIGLIQNITPLYQSIISCSLGDIHLYIQDYFIHYLRNNSQVHNVLPIPFLAVQGIFYLKMIRQTGVLRRYI